MKYNVGGGTFAKFENVGDRVEGVITGITVGKNFDKTVDQEVVVVRNDKGETQNVAIAQTALVKNWGATKAAEGSVIGKRVIFLFEKTYRSNRGGRPGKEISVEIVDGPGAPAPASIGVVSDAIEAAINKLVEAKGADAAAAIRKAIETVATSADEQLKMLQRAAGVAA